MRTILFILISTLFISAHANNDSIPKTKEEAKEFKDKAPDERAKSITDMMNEKLKLSAPQYKSIYDINVKYAKLNDDIFNKGYSKLQMYSKLKSVNTEREKEIRAQLDTTQKAIFEQEKSAMISQFKSMRK